MAGDPLEWKLQETIALIPDDVWQAGPEAVTIGTSKKPFELAPLDYGVADQLRESWSVEYLDLRAEAHELVETIGNLEAASDINIAK